MLVKSSLGALEGHVGTLGGHVGTKVENKFNFVEKVIWTTPLTDPFGSLFGTFSSVGRPWDLKCG